MSETAATDETTQTPTPNGEKERTRGGLPPTLAARQRREEKEEKERDELTIELDTILKKVDWSGDKFRVTLHRVEPEFVAGIKVTGVVEHFTSYPDIVNIMEKHGGHTYEIRVFGPDPDDPKKKINKMFRLPRIAVPPKTYSPDQYRVGMPLNQAPPPPTGTSDAALNMVQQMMTQFMGRMEGLANKAPVVDPAAIEKLTNEREERRQQHEIMLKKLDNDAADRRASDQRARDEAKAERDRAEAQAAEARKAADSAEQRRHESEMLRLKLEADQRKADADARRADDAARREEQNRLLGVLQDNQKTTLTSIKEMTESLAKKKDDDDILDKMIKWDDFTSRLRGKGGDDDNGLRKGLVKTLDRAVDKVDVVLSKFLMGSEPATQKPAAEQKAVTLQPGTMSAVEIPLEPAQQKALAAPAEPEPPLEFQWPKDETEPREVFRMLGENVEKALQAAWDHKRIFKDIVLKFPRQHLDTIRVFSLDMALVELEKNAPEGSKLRSERGRMVIRLLHGALVRKFST